MKHHPDFRLFPFLSVLFYMVLTAALAHADETEIRFGFETGDLDGWVVVEGSFEEIVSGRKLFHHGVKAYNKDGSYFLSTLEQSDGSPSDKFTGTIESPVFTLDGPEISMLVGGGGHSNTYVALCTKQGTEIAHARGKGMEQMHRVSWNLPDHVGQQVFLRIVDTNTGGWGHITFDDFTADGRIDQIATTERFANLGLLKMRRSSLAILDKIRFEPLRKSIEHLSKIYPNRYLVGENHSKRLASLEAKKPDMLNLIVHADEAALSKISDYARKFELLRQEALTANPLVSENPILFIVRNQYKPDHHNTATLFQTNEVNTGSFENGGAMKMIDAGGKVTTLIELTEGIVRDPEIHFDGDKIIFSMRRDIDDDYHIYEIGTDGSNLTQLTFAESVSDIDPLYLPDGSIVFSSSREPKYCMCNKHIMVNLFRMDSDGANIHQIGKSTLFEGHASLMPDGRLLYDRWEYIDRNFGDAQGLWTSNPDGTNHAVFWGNNTSSPGGVIDAQFIPGTERAICVFGSCHDRPWGALTIVDRSLGLDGRPPVIRTWPESAIDIVGKGNWDAFVPVRPKYEDPYVLSENYFLCSRMTGEGEKMGMYLLDTFGNELLLHTEGPGCFDPMPVAPRKRPPVIPSRMDFSKTDGSLYVMDVYNGTHMKGVKKGSVKYLRVIESPEKRSWNKFPWNGQGTLWPAMNWHDFNNKRILGTVPVEEDGSAYFKLPSDTYVYFQLLDRKGRMIQTMRSGTIVQPGEITGCIGCHDNRRSAPPVATTKMATALTREPSKLDGWYGAPRLFNYMTEVQPVFNDNCTRCHDYGKKAGEKLNLAADRTNTFNTSYNEMWRKKIITAIGGGPADMLQPYTWGSNVSRIISVLDKGHNGIELDEESMDRIEAWIDINGPYYPVYSTAYPDNLAGRSPLDPDQMKRLSELTGAQFEKYTGFAVNKGPKISFDRPELSPCIAGITDKTSAEYREALSIIQSGQAMLAERPRADMGGFQANMIDRLRFGKYVMREEAERRNRKAIVTGAKQYERPEGQ